MKTIVLFDNETGETKGYIKLAMDSDVSLYPPDSCVEIPNDHPAIHDQDGWMVVDRKLQRK